MAGWELLNPVSSKSLGPSRPPREGGDAVPTIPKGGARFPPPPPAGGIRVASGNPGLEVRTRGECTEKAASGRPHLCRTQHLGHAHKNMCAHPCCPLLFLVPAPAPQGLRRPQPGGLRSCQCRKWALPVPKAWGRGRGATFSVSFPGSSASLGDPATCQKGDP